MRIQRGGFLLGFTVFFICALMNLGFAEEKVESSSDGKKEIKNFLVNGTFANEGESWETNIGRAKGTKGTLSFSVDSRFSGKVLTYKVETGNLCFSQYVKGLVKGEKYVYTGHLKAKLKRGQRATAWVLGDWKNYEMEYKLGKYDEWVEFAEVFELKNDSKSIAVGVSLLEGEEISIANLGLYTYADYAVSHGDISSDWKDVLYNGGFEKKSNSDIPEAWYYNFVWPNVATLVRQVSDNPHSGKYCMELKSPSKWTNKSGTTFNGTSCNIASYINNLLSIKKGDKFRISFFARSEPAGQKVFATLNWINRSPEYPVTDEWKRYVYEAEAAKNANELYVILHKSTDTGKVLYLDDVTLEIMGLVSSDKQKAMKLISSSKLETLKTAEPMREDFLVANGFFDHQTADDALNKTRVYAYATSDKLFIKFVCMTNGTKSQYTQCDGRDDAKNIFKNEVGEIFIQTDKDEYRHFVFDTGGAVFDQIVRGSNYDVSWNGKWTHTISKTNDSWVALLEIPHADYLSGKEVMKELRINFCREIPGDISEYSAWSAPYGGFHNPERFGVLRPSDESVVEERHVGVVSIKSKKDFKSNALLVHGIFSGNISEGTSFTITAQNKQYLASMTKINEQQWEGTVTLPMETTAEQMQSYGILDANKREIFNSPNICDIEELRPFSSYCDKSYYDIESSAKLILNVDTENPPPQKESYSVLDSVWNLFWGSSQSKNRYVVKWAMENSKFEGEDKCQVPGMVIDIPVKQLSIGVNRILLSVFDGSGKKVYENTHELLKSLPSENHRSKIDHKRLCLEVDGQPRIIKSMMIELRDSTHFKRQFGEGWEGYIDAICEFIAELPGLGFNAIAFFNTLSDDADTEKARDKIMDAATKNGLYVLLDMSFPQDGEKLTFEQFANLSLSTLRKLKNHSNIIAYSSIDEPDLFWMEETKSKFKYAESDLQTLYQIYKNEVAPLPVYINYNCRWVRRFYGGKAATDIYSFDRYVFGRDEPSSFTGDEWLKETSFLHRHSDIDRKPLQLWIQNCIGYTWAVIPNEEQMIYQGYFSIINEAYFISHFTFHLRPESIDPLNGWKQFSKECDTLQSPLLDGEKVDIASSDDQILLLAKRYAGKIYLITLNPSQEKKTATIKLKGEMLKSKDLSVLFENRTISIKGDAISDSYGPLERHVYLLDLGE